MVLTTEGAVDQGLGMSLNNDTKPGLFQIDPLSENLFCLRCGAHSGFSLLHREAHAPPHSLSLLRDIKNVIKSIC